MTTAQIALLLFVAAATSSIPCDAQSFADYDLDEPSRRFQLPAELREISALTDISPTIVACLQDEAGIIFYLDHTTGAITRRMKFAGPGDYEGLTRIGEDLFALRSDGLIHQLRENHGAMDVIDTFRVDVPNRNLESLGYDEKRQVLLIAAKDNLKGGKDLRDLRYIYGWDMKRGKQMKDAVLTLSVKKILAEAKALGIVVPLTERKHGLEPAFKLRPSSVTVHPADDTYWILSAKDHAMLVLDRAGKLQALHFLDPALYSKAEGMTFLGNGDLLISSEGMDSDGVLLFHKRH